MVVVWLTGLPASGKTTIASILKTLLESYGENVRIIDGDEIRKSVSKNLGFSENDRKVNAEIAIRLAKEWETNNTFVIVSLITPYQSSRDLAQKEIKKYVEVWVKTSLAECMRRDPKGLYKKALQGKISNFTGIQSPYEDPINPHLVVETENFSKEDCAKKIVEKLEELGYVRRENGLYPTRT